MNKKQTCDNKHLSLDERKIIQTGIENRCNKVDIARTLGKAPTTIAKEIRKLRESLNGKTPYEMMEFLYGCEIIELLNIKQIKRDEVILKPYLIKHIYKK